MNFVTDLKVGGDLSRERKPVLHYYNFSYFAHFQDARDRHKRDFWGLATVPKHSSQDGLVSASVCAGGLAATLVRTQGTSAACGLARCALEFSPVRKPFLCNTRSSWCHWGAAAQGQPQPSIFGVRFLARAAFARAGCGCHRAG